MAAVSPLEIRCEWVDGPNGTPEVRETMSHIDIRVGTVSATRAESLWSASVTERPLLSAYPLAQWFAANWWRLRYEAPLPLPTLSWRGAHDLASAGGGFVWPPLSLHCDGEAVQVVMRPSSTSALVSLRYLSELNERIPVAEYEMAIAAFLALVCERLADRGLVASELVRLWSEVASERADATTTDYRRFEAELGFDPDEAPPDTVERLLALRDIAGPAAAHEIASALADGLGHPQADRLVSGALEQGFRGSVSCPRVMAAAPSALPWERGYEAARRLRRMLGMGSGRVSDAALAELFELPPAILDPRTSPGTSLPVSLAIGRGPDVHLFLRKRNLESRRFECARLLGDYAVGPDDNWRPATDTGTSRQKVQRAFAAEFLCPIDGLRDLLQGDVSEDGILHAAREFTVSPLVVTQNLENAGIPVPEAAITTR